MILHASVVVDEPKAAANTFAVLLGGRALPVGPGEGTWTAIGPDPVGNMVSFLHRGSEFHRLPGEHLETRIGSPVRHSGFHLLVDTHLSESEVDELAKQRGCESQRVAHGAFEVIEFWFDDCLLVEVVTPELGVAYRNMLTSDALRQRMVTQFGGAA